LEGGLGGGGGRKLKLQSFDTMWHVGLDKSYNKSWSNLTFYFNYDLACRGLSNISSQILTRIFPDAIIDLGLIMEWLPSLQILWALSCSHFMRDALWLMKVHDVMWMDILMIKLIPHIILGTILFHPSWSCLWP